MPKTSYGYRMLILAFGPDMEQAPPHKLLNRQSGACRFHRTLPKVSLGHMPLLATTVSCMVTRRKPL